MFNYGFCHIHNRVILKKKYYKLFLRYITYIFTIFNSKSWMTKLIMIDMGKQLIIKYDLKTIDYIILFYSKYFFKYKPINNKIKTDYKLFYTEYNLKYPPEEWVKHCNKKKIII